MPAKKDFAAALIKLIEDEIAKEPYVHYGQTWAVVTGDGQDGLAHHFGVSVKVVSLVPIGSETTQGHDRSRGLIHGAAAKSRPK